MLEMQVFIDTISTPLDTKADKVLTEAGIQYRLFIYRLRKKFPDYTTMVVRGSFEDSIELANYKSKESHYEMVELKREFCLYGIYFEENSGKDLEFNFGSYTDNLGTKALMVMEDWDNTDDVQIAMEFMYDTAKVSKITDVVFDNLDDIQVVLDANDELKMAGLDVEVWFKEIYNTLTLTFNDEVEEVKKDYGEEAVHDVSDELYELVKPLENNYITYKVIQDFLSLATSWVNAGYQVLTCHNNTDAILNRCSESGRAYVEKQVQLMNAFLICLFEDYHFKLIVDNVSTFMREYGEYRKGAYSLTEDIFESRYRLRSYMFNPTNLMAGTGNLLYLRGVDYDYTYKYLSLSQLDAFISGPVHSMLRTYSPIKKYDDNRVITYNSERISTTFNNHQATIKQTDDKDKLFYSEFSDLDYDYMADDNSTYSIIPLYDAIASQYPDVDVSEKLEDIVKAFNIAVAETAVELSKPLTVRDLFVRERYSKDDSDTPLDKEIGYVTCNKDYIYGGRMKENIIISRIVNDVPTPTMFEANDVIVTNLMSVDAIYNLKSMSFYEDVERTYSLPESVYDISVVYDDNDEVVCDEDGQAVREIPNALSLKYCVYLISSMLTKSYGTNCEEMQNLTKFLSENRPEFLTSLFPAVVSTNRVAPELVKLYGLESVVKGEVLDYLGNLNEQEYVKTIEGQKLLNLSNKLFGEMKVSE